MERRKFLENTALLAGGILLAPGLAAASGSAAATPVRVGIIGCGDRGTGIFSILKTNRNFKVAAFCDVLDFRLAKLTELNPAIPVYKDYRSLLDDKTIDAVIIATPLNMHYPVATDSLKAGKHVYLEKTMTFTIDQALKLVKLAKKYPKQVLQVGHQYRYSPLYYRVKDMINKGYLGKVTEIESRWDRNGNWRRPVPDPTLERAVNWRMYREYSGGLVAELLSHQIDFIDWVFDTHADEVIASGGIDFYKDGRETYDNVQAILRYRRDGMIGNFGATCSNAHDGYSFRIKGTKGTISLLTDKGLFFPEKDLVKDLGTIDGVSGATKLAWQNGTGTPIETGPMKDGTWYALADFFDCVSTGKLPDSNVLTGARTAITVHMANKSMYERTRESWKDEYAF